MTVPHVYLAGRMTGLTDRGGGWREEAASCLLPLVAIDPLQSEIGAGTPQEIVQVDIGSICRSRCVLAYVGQPSWGTAMELWQAKQLGVPVVGWMTTEDANQRLSPWVRFVVSHGMHVGLSSAVATVRSMFRDSM